MTILILSTIILTVLSFFFHSFIRKFNLYLYGLAIILSIISFTQEVTIINLGYLGFSFMIVVMFASTLDSSKLKKHLMGNRAEYAVLGSIFALTHGIKYLVFSIDFGFLFRSPAYFYLGFAAVVIMIPLAVTSIMWIRKKIKGKDWKNLHKLSYLFYALIFLHVLFINNDRFLFYLVLAILYGVYKSLSIVNKQKLKR